MECEDDIQCDEYTDNEHIPLASSLTGIERVS